MDCFSLDFVGVGSPKAGTTWLVECLQEHPAICMSRPKELCYFGRAPIWSGRPSNYKLGEAWLRSRFSHSLSGQKKGEFSNNYMNDPDSPRLIKEHSPGVKLIFSYRKPTDMLYSLYFQLSKEFPLPDTFEKFLVQFPKIIEGGYYYTQTKRFLNVFPSENMLFILYDDICENPRKVLTELFRFLGVDPDFIPKSLNKKINIRKAPRSTLLRNLINSVNNFFHATPGRIKFKFLLRDLGLHRLTDWVIAKNLCAMKFPPMRPETGARLISLYAEENQALADLLERDLSHWNE